MQSTVAVPSRHPRRRRRTVIVLVGVLAVSLLGCGTAVAILGTPQPAPAPLSLPPAGAAGDVAGSWTIGPGSAAGFRVRQTMIGSSSDVVGRTTIVTGDAVIAGDQLTAARFEIDLTTIRVDGERQKQFDESLDTAHHPRASFALTEPVVLGKQITTGTITNATAIGRLTIRGITHQVRFPISGRRTATALHALGTIPIGFSDYEIKQPKSYGPLGSLADYGTAEFHLVLDNT